MSSKLKYLYVGCGNDRLDGFTHIEIDPAKQFKNGIKVPPPDILADITKKIPIKDGVSKLIFSANTLEHLKYRELINHLIECHRVLELNGEVRINVPDLDKMIDNYINKNDNIFEAKKKIEKNDDLPVENCSHLLVARLLYHDHYYTHNFETMKYALEEVGFEKIIKSSPGENINPELPENIKNKIIYTEMTCGDDMLVINATKKKSDTKIKKYNLENKNFFLINIITNFFNIKISKKNLRRPSFPKKIWFYEKYLLIKQFIKGLLN